MFDQKISALDAHQSQVYEWLPWVGGYFEQVPVNQAERLPWLRKTMQRPITPAVRLALEKWYGKDRGAGIQFAEAFQVGEYGAQPDEVMLRKLFPMVGK